MKILIVSSGSGGHIYPSLAFGNYLLKKGYDVTYLGIKGRMEEDIIKENIILTNIPYSFKNCLKNIDNFFASKKMIQKISLKYDKIICFGGFITFYMSLFSKNKNIYLHEQNVVLGDSIRFSLFKYKKLFVSFPLKGKKNVYTLNPTLDLIGRRKYSPIIKKILFVFGSLGSSTLIKKTLEFLDKTNLKNKEFVLVGGKNNKIKDKRIIPYIDLKKEIDSFDLVFTRSGATSLLELIKNGINICTIPSPFVKNNHQEKNALYLKNQGLVDVIKEKDYSIETIEKMIKKYDDATYSYKMYSHKKQIDFFSSCLKMEQEIND